MTPLFITPTLKHQMKKSQIILIAIVFLSYKAMCQIPVSSKIYFAKEFSKEITLYRAKSFLIDEVTRPEKTLHFKKLILVLLYSGIS